MAASIGIVVGLVGAGVSAQGSAKAGRKAKRIGAFNAGVAEQQAADALILGREAEDQLRSGTRKLMGQQRAGFAAQGVSLNDVDSSAVDVEEDTIKQRDRDIERIRLNAAREAWGYRVQAMNYRMGGSAQFNQRQGEAYGTILAGLGQAFTNYSTVSAQKKSTPKS